MNVYKVSKRRAISAEEAVNEILTWVENKVDNDDDNFVPDPNIDPDAPESDGNVTDEDELRGDGPTRRQHRRKTLTYQRNVNRIDTALDESNYNQVEIPTDEKIATGYIPDKVHKNKKIEVSFSSHKPSVAGRQRSCDVINNMLGLTAYSKDADTPEKAFALFIRRPYSKCHA